jgi:hypothetical protein
MSEAEVSVDHRKLRSVVQSGLVNPNFVNLLFREAGQARKHVLHAATMVSLDMSTFGKLVSAAEGYLQH